MADNHHQFHVRVNVYMDVKLVVVISHIVFADDVCAHDAGRPWKTFRRDICIYLIPHDDRYTATNKSCASPRLCACMCADRKWNTLIRFKSNSLVSGAIVDYHHYYKIGVSNSTARRMDFQRNSTRTRQKKNIGFLEQRRTGSGDRTLILGTRDILADGFGFWYVIRHFGNSLLLRVQTACKTRENEKTLW